MDRILSKQREKENDKKSDNILFSMESVVVVDVPAYEFVNIP